MDYMGNEIEQERRKRKEQLMDIHHKMNKAIANPRTDDGRVSVSMFRKPLLWAAVNAALLLWLAYGVFSFWRNN